MKNKTCIFCGKPPIDKNKEHIIPQWLMKLTGTLKKNMSVGSNWKTGQEQVFNFSQFTFPSCTSCNSEYAKKEALVKPIIEKLLVDDFIDKDEIIELLDWFDKVRIGLFYGVMYLNNKNLNLEPKYCINSRIGLKDRFLAITNCYDGSKTLGWTGVNSYIFMSSPTTFTLRINNLLLTNCSSDFIVSKQLGFPYPEFLMPKSDDSPEIDMLMKKGLLRVSAPLFKSKLYNPAIIISQPIFTVGKTKKPDYYENDYIKNSSLNFEKGIGDIFITEYGKTEKLEEDETICSVSDEPNIAKHYKFNSPTINFQIEIFDYIKYNLTNLTKEQQKMHYKARRFMKKNAQEQIRQYDY